MGAVALLGKDNCGGTNLVSHRAAGGGFGAGAEVGVELAADEAAGSDEVTEDRAFLAESVGFGIVVRAVTGQNFGLIPELVFQGEANPHFPIQNIRQLWSEGADGGVRVAADDECRKLNNVARGDSGEEMVADARLALQDVRKVTPVAVSIDVEIAGEPHRDIRGG